MGKFESLALIRCPRAQTAPQKYRIIVVFSNFQNTSRTIKNDEDITCVASQKNNLQSA